MIKESERARDKVGRVAGQSENRLALTRTG
jgi:hypothetical protein